MVRIRCAGEIMKTKYARSFSGARVGLSRHVQAHLGTAWVAKYQEENI